MSALKNMPISFPGLFGDWELNIDPVAIHIGHGIYWYGIILAVAMLAGLYLCMKQAKRYGLTKDNVLDMVLWAVPIGVICARLYYCVFYWDLYRDNPISMLYIWEGGLAIYGGIIGAFLFGGLACKWRKVPVLPMFDLAAMGFLIGQGCGRWGNFFNQEAFGCNTTLPWGMYSQATHDYLTSSVVTVPKGVTIDPNLPVHPTFLYESIWCFVGLFLLVRYLKKRRFAGDIALRYLIWYGAGRFWIEALRTDSLLLVPSIGLRVSQLVAGVAVVGGVIAEILLTRKFRDKPLMVELPLNSENRARMKKLDGPTTFAGTDAALPASASRAEFVEKTAAWNETVKEGLERREHPEKNEKNPE